MGIEVIHDQDDFLGIGILLVKNFLHESCPILFGPVFSYLEIALPSERLISNEEIGTALFLIGVVFSCDLARLGRFGGYLSLTRFLPISSIQILGTAGS